MQTAAQLELVARELAAGEAGRGETSAGRPVRTYDDVGREQNVQSSVFPVGLGNGAVGPL